MVAIGKNKFSQFPVFLLSAVLNDAKIMEWNNSIGERKVLLSDKIQSTYTVFIRMNVIDIETLIIFIYTILTNFYI